MEIIWPMLGAGYITIVVSSIFYFVSCMSEWWSGVNIVMKKYRIESNQIIEGWDRQVSPVQPLSNIIVLLY